MAWVIGFFLLVGIVTLVYANRLDNDYSLPADERVGSCLFYIAAMAFLGVAVVLIILKVLFP